MTLLAEPGASVPIPLATGCGAEVRRVALFLSVGLVGLAVDAAVFSCLFDTGLSRGLCRAPAILSATVVTYAVNRRWSFTGQRLFTFRRA